MRFDVLSPFKHDGVLYKIGQTIEAEAEQLAEMVGLGHAQASADQPAAVPTDPSARIEAIKAAIGTLDKENTDLWLKDGKPAAEAIAAVTGWPITAGERNDAWASLQAAAPAAQPAADSADPARTE